MPMYEYRCPNCGSVATVTDTRDGPIKARFDSGTHPCSECACGVYRRRFGFSFTPILHTHYNHTVRDVVHGHRDFRNKLRRMSAENEARTGIPTNLQPRDHEELRREALDRYGDAGLKEQHDAAVKAGLKEPTGRKVL